MSSPASSPDPLRSHPGLAWFPDHAVAVWCETLDPSSRVLWGRMDGCAPPSAAAPVTAGGTNIQREPVIAAGADWGLIVWEEGGPAGTGIAAGVVGPAGFPTPLSSVVVSAGPGCRRPAVAINGAVGLILWEHMGSSGSELRYARWDANDGLLDPGGVPVPSSGRARYHPRIAGGTNGFLGVWSEADPGAPTGVFGGRWFEGGVFDGLVGRLSDPGSVSDNPDVAAAAGGFLTAWNRLTSPAVVEARFSGPAGLPQGSVVTLVSGAESNFIPRLGTGAECELVWSRQGAAGRSLRRARVDAAGGLTPPDGQELSGPSANAAEAALAADGVQSAALWRVPTPDDTDSLAADCWPGSGTTGAEVAPRATLAAFPNPFRVRVALALESPEAGESQRTGTTVDVFDVRGRRVRSLSLSETGTAVWDGRTESGSDAPAGRYLIRILPGKQTFSVTKLR